MMPDKARRASDSDALAYSAFSSARPNCSGLSFM
jgi:hypothetical protein